MAPQALTAANLSKLPKAQRTDQLLKLAQMKIDADEDASFLLEKVQQELAASSSGRPGTGSQKPPPTAGGLSIAGSLQDRIADSILSRQSEFRKGKDQLAALLEESSRPATGASRPGTGASRRPPTASSVRPPPTAASDRSTRSAKMADGQKVLPFGAYDADRSELLAAFPEELKEKFRQEFRAMKAREAAEAAAFEAAAEISEPDPAPSLFQPGQREIGTPLVQNAMPLSEMKNLNIIENRLPTPSATSVASSRPLTGHAEITMAKTEMPTLAPRPWSKKGRRPPPSDARAARSEISSALSWN